jgi:hypothetical protein
MVDSFFLHVDLDNRRHGDRWVGLTYSGPFLRTTRPRADGDVIGNVYSVVANLLTKDEARSIASNIARLRVPLTQMKTFRPLEGK